MTTEMKIWQDALALIQEELASATFHNFIVDLVPYGIEKNTFVLLSPEEFKREHLRNRYADIVARAVQEASGRRYEVDFILATEKKTPDDPDENVSPHTINRRYTFDTFVIGQSNHFAHAAANTVANNPGCSYNPLFIYGGVGLGKTHLMHAIGNQIHQDHPDWKIVYTTTENFSNELITAIGSGRTDVNERFRNRYRSLDVLMVDDIQFISNRDATQVEFFNTFNQLYENQKQIVISSDKPPKEIPTLEDRLRSRFEWGLQVDIQAPDFETRVAILQKKAEVENLTVDQSVLEFIAEKIKSNIRELEGTLTRVIAYSNLLNQPIDLRLAAEALKDFIPPGAETAVTIETIVDIVADYYKITADDIYGQKRNREIALPRQIVMYLSRTLTENSLDKIGATLGGRDHGTIHHGAQKIKKTLLTDLRLQTEMEDLTKRIAE